MKHVIFIWSLLVCQVVAAQNHTLDFQQTIQQHRQHYKEEFLKETRSPLTAKDTAFLDFFPADIQWQVKARFTATPDAQPFDMPTYSGKTAQYQQYGVLAFDKNGTTYSLAVYQNLRLLKMPEYQDYLFLPFKDLTNGDISYGGGRYFEFRTGDLSTENGQTWMTLDFNTCFNPYCAYSDGYNCPVPPKVNHLPIAVEAGERQFKGEKKH
jgi:hypothetical protein